VGNLVKETEKEKLRMFWYQICCGGKIENYLKKYLKEETNFFSKCRNESKF
jgi:hypothetical protein